ncbi:MAG: hypothetical protein GIKADHBN_02143 [Phycisphaerales bacterium]|nr:hypothetical protein [Phycisphaerales bacterium]
MKTVVLTGGLGYSGSVIARRLLERGDRVRTLTNSPDRPSPIAHRLDIRRMDFADPDALVAAMDGADAFINTYWVRFNHRLFSFDQAVANTRLLFESARRAGVPRIVHTSILKAEQGRGLAYYDGKLRLEQDLRKLGVSSVIVRPGVLFGRGDILLNNIAWALRRLPIFGVFGAGEYKLQPMHVDDFADLVVGAVDGDAPAVCDAVGPETFSYRDLVALLGRAIGVRRRVVSLPPSVAYAFSRLVGPFVGDIVITREEIEGLMRGLLFSDSQARGSVRLSEWVRSHSHELGVRYASELGRRTDRAAAYTRL